MTDESSLLGLVENRMQKLEADLSQAVSALSKILAGGGKVEREIARNALLSLRRCKEMLLVRNKEGVYFQLYTLDDGALERLREEGSDILSWEPNFFTFLQWTGKEEGWKRLDTQVVSPKAKEEK